MELVVALVSLAVFIAILRWFANKIRRDEREWATRNFWLNKRSSSETSYDPEDPAKTND